MNSENVVNQKQKSRAKYKCPAELEDLIYQVNLIPVDFQMQSLYFLLQHKLTVTEALKDCLQYTPQEFQEHLEFLAGCKKDMAVESESARKAYVRKMADAYIEYYEMRMSMLMLVRRLEAERQNPNDFFDWLNFPLVLRTPVVRNADGKLQTIGLAALIGKFDESRLRSCQSCKQVFWAKRIESETCSPRCLNAFNVRRYRSLSDEEKAERKNKRLENRQIQKKLKERRKKNGTL